MEKLGEGGASLDAAVMVDSCGTPDIGWHSLNHRFLLCFLGRLIDLRFRLPRLLWFVTGAGARGGGRRGWKESDSEGEGSVAPEGGGGGCGGGKGSSRGGVSGLVSSSGC